jgi:hypothetical protein
MINRGGLTMATLFLEVAVIDFRGDLVADLDLVLRPCPRQSY